MQQCPTGSPEGTRSRSAPWTPSTPTGSWVTYGSYINRNSNETRGCAPAGNLYTGVKNGTCNIDIVLSTSTTADASPPAPGQARTDQFWQGAAFGPDGTFAVSYYDRQCGADENIGFSGITLSTTDNLATFRHTWPYVKAAPRTPPSPTTKAFTPKHFH